MSRIQADTDYELTKGIELLFKKTVAPILVLRLLSKQKCYITEIPKKVEEMTDGAVKLCLPYTICTRLRSNGLIAVDAELKDGRKRQIYKITEKGLDFLRQQSASYINCVNSVAAVFREE